MQFIGRILAVTSESVVMSTNDPSRGDAISLRAGAQVRAQAQGLLNRVVRYTAEVDASTRCLSNPRFVIGSEFGLRAVTMLRAASASDAVRELDTAAWSEAAAWR